MAFPPLNKSTLLQYKAAVAKITPQSTPKWGKLTATGVISHLRIVMQISLGEIHVKPMNSAFLKLTLVRKLMLIMPMPKGVKAPAELTPEPTETFQQEMKALNEAMERFAAKVEENPKQVIENPVFGPITIAEQAKLHANHTRHHLKQFGAL